MKLSTALVMAILCLSVAAENVACVLNGGGYKDTTKIEFSSIDEDGYAYSYTPNGVMDLSMSMEVYCENKNCEVTMTIDSATLEDEAGQDYFELVRGLTPYGVVFNEPITNAPDGNKYFLYCYYNN